MMWVLGGLTVSYLIGSSSGSLLLGRLRNVDIRTLGSGNAGGTNALRTQGFRFAADVMSIDVGKGALAAWIGLQSNPDPTMALRTALGCGSAAVVGHVWPIFHGFRGGKGVATILGMLLVLWPGMLLLMFTVSSLVLTTTGHVSLGSMLAVATMLPALWLRPAPPMPDWVVVASGLTAFVVFTHRATLRRLMTGCEYRFEKARLLARLFRR